MKALITGLLIPLTIYLIITLLHILVPGRKVTGYVTDEKTGNKLKYILNGRRVLIISILIWTVAGLTNLVPFEWLYTVRYYSFAGAFAMG